MLTDEKAMDAYLTSWMAHKYPRFLGNRFFQATVKTATARATFGYTCTLAQVGETAADGATYLSPQPAANYTPAAGHVVQCVWLDDSTALILFRLS
jgi:hypothetical protein